MTFLSLTNTQIDAQQEFKHSYRDPTCLLTLCFAKNHCKVVTATAKDEIRNLFNRRKNCHTNHTGAKDPTEGTIKRLLRKKNENILIRNL